MKLKEIGIRKPSVEDQETTDLFIRLGLHRFGRSFSLDFERAMKRAMRDSIALPKPDRPSEGEG